MDADDLMMIALDAGAEDFSEEDDSYEIITNPNDFEAVHAALEAEKIPMAEAEVSNDSTELCRADSRGRFNKYQPYS